MTARFITFEGLDGSGKSTHLEAAGRWLESSGVACRVTREPGGTELGRAIREIFLDVRWGRMDGVVEALLVFASRRQNLLEVIDPALAAGEIVLCDRFTDSTRVYQGFGHGVAAEVLASLDGIATGGRVPDRTLFFDLPADAARRRGHSGERVEAGGVDRLDREELAFYERVREGYLELIAAEPERFRVIDSSGSVEATQAQVFAALADLVEDAS